MTQADIINLIQDNEKLLSGASIVETHISWVLLSPKYAYKIKKPVSFSFLDFSSLDNRYFFCQRELSLNRRLTENIYQAVIPICRTADQHLVLGEKEEEEIIDYAVKMKRMESDRQMHLLLEKDLVNRFHIKQLADQLANFHMSTEVVIKHPKLHEMQKDFADLLKIESFLEEHWGAEAALCLHKGVEYSNQTLSALRKRIYERHLEGFTVDGHGDLHAKNIFLLDEPVIFDCIEFDDHLRQLDVLNELAFLCMDLDLYKKNDLSNYLIEQYNKRHVCINCPADERIFEYYKLYRANVRLKTNVYSARQIEDAEDLEKQLSLVKSYLELFEYYLEAF